MDELIVYYLWIYVESWLVCIEFVKIEWGNMALVELRNIKLMIIEMFKHYNWLNWITEIKLKMWSMSFLIPLDVVAVLLSHLESGHWLRGSHRHFSSPRRHPFLFFFCVIFSNMGFLLHSPLDWAKILTVAPKQMNCCFERLDLEVYR